MKPDSNELFSESIKLEHNMADLYMLFFQTFLEDQELWKKLNREEHEHAKILTLGKEYYEPMGVLPDGFYCPDLDAIRDSNRNIAGLVKKYQEQTPSRLEALEASFDLENNLGELHYQGAEDCDKNDDKTALFQKLCRQDRYHADVIKKYMNDNLIETSI